MSVRSVRSVRRNECARSRVASFVSRVGARMRTDFYSISIEDEVG